MSFRFAVWGMDAVSPLERWGSGHHLPIERRLRPQVPGWRVVLASVCKRASEVDHWAEKLEVLLVDAESSR